MEEEREGGTTEGTARGETDKQQPISPGTPPITLPCPTSVLSVPSTRVLAPAPHSIHWLSGHLGLPVCLKLYSALARGSRIHPPSCPRTSASWPRSLTSLGMRICAFTNLPLLRAFPLYSRSIPLRLSQIHEYLAGWRAIERQTSPRVLNGFCRPNAQGPSKPLTLVHKCTFPF